jgi:hypothetical protein
VGHDRFVEAAQRHRAQLRVVPDFTAQLSQRLFWGALLALVFAGITLVLMLNVSLQTQAFDLRTLAAQEQRLQNQEAVLQQQLAERSSSAELAQRAIDLGMVPATAPGFVMLPEGTMVGDPQAVGADGPYADLRTPATPAPDPSAAPTESTAAAAADPTAGPAEAGEPATVRTPAPAPVEDPADQAAGQQAGDPVTVPEMSTQEG